MSDVGMEPGARTGIGTRIGIIVLAAGASRRMGRPKQLLAFAGGTLLDHALSQALASKCGPVLVVLGAQGEQIKEALAPSLLSGTAVVLVNNAEWQEGLASSIRAGIDALLRWDVEKGIEAAILCSCDQPALSAALIDTMIGVYVESAGRAQLVAARYADTVGIPALFGRQLFPELLQLEGDRGAKGIIQKYAASSKLVEFPAGVLDIDEPGDYEKLRLTLSTNFRSG